MALHASAQRAVVTAGGVLAPLALRVGHAVADELCSGRVRGIGPQQLRRVRRQRRVGQRRHRQAQLLQQAQQAPGAHAVAPLTPRVVEHVGLRRRRHQLRAKAAAEVEVLQVDGHVYRQPRAVAPRAMRALRDAAIGEALVAAQLQRRRHGVTHTRHTRRVNTANAKAREERRGMRRAGTSARRRRRSSRVKRATRVRAGRAATARHALLGRGVSARQACGAEVTVRDGRGARRQRSFAPARVRRPR